MMRIPLIDNYSKEELKQIVSQSKCMNQVIDKLGYSTHSGNNRNTVKSRLQKYNIDTSHFCVSNGLTVRSDEQVFIENSKVSQHCLRNRIISNQIFPYVCSICGQIPEWNGKQLPLILDHKNGKNHDNRIENLRWVCPNCNQQLPTTCGRNTPRRNSYVKKLYYCKKCGKQITKNSKSGYCISCEKRDFYHNYIPSRNELKNMIRTIPFMQIGEKYSVSDNAVRKWCKLLNLPHTKREINTYSDIQWADV